MEKCENCGRIIGNLETPLIWKNSVVCDGCKRYLELQSNPVSSADHRSHLCPKCHSDDTAKLEVVYESGKTDGSFIGMDFIGTSTGFFAGGGSNQSLLSQRASPPLGRSNIPFIIFLSSIGVCVASFLDGCSLIESTSNQIAEQGRTLLSIGWFGIIVAIFSGFFTFLNWKWNRTELPARYENWNKKWACRRCGNTFLPKN